MTITSFPPLIFSSSPLIFRRTTKATRTKEPGEPRDSEEEEEPLEVESHDNQQIADPKEQEILMCYNALSSDNNDVSCGYLTPKTSPFRHRKGDSAWAEQRVSKVKDFMDFSDD